MAPMIAVMGPMLVRAGPDEVVLRGQAAVVAAALVDAAPLVVPLDRLAEALWAGRPPSTHRAVMQVVVSRLRKLAGEGAVLFEGNGYRLDLAVAHTDVHEFRTLVAQASAAASPTEAVGLLEQALALHRGDPFVPVDDRPELELAAAALVEERRLAEELLVERLLVVDPVAAAGRATVLAQAEPLRERRWLQLMLALYRTGRQAEALRVAHQVRARLNDELGLDPGPELRDLEQQILRHDPALDGPAPTEAAAPPAASAPASAPSSGSSPAASPLPLGSRRAAVPAPASLFVGRDADRSGLEEALAAARLVSITGPPGVGKTRLAAEVARSEAGPVVWLDLAADAGVDLVPLLAEQLGVRVPEGGSVAALADRLDGRVLVVLDNCEADVEAAGRLAEMLLRATDAQVLCTSRQALGTESELRVVLDPLPPEDAVRLLGARLHGRSVPDDELAAVAARVDHLPLAIELAATHLRTMSAAELLADLDRSQEVLTAPGWVEVRHRGLDECLATSVDRLGPDDRRLLVATAVLPGRFVAEDLAAVAGVAPSEARRGLRSLEERSLVGAEADGPLARFRVLETVRAHARHLAGPDGERALRAAHADWFARLAADHVRRLRDDREEAAVARLALADDQLREAWLWCLAEADLDRGMDLVDGAWEWSFMRLRFSHQRWAQDLLAAVGADIDGHPRGLDLLAVAALAAWSRNEAESALHLADRVWGGADGDLMRVPPRALMALFNVHGQRGDFEAGYRAVDGYRQQAMAAGDGYRIADAFTNLGVAYAIAGFVEPAARAAAKAWPLAEATRNSSLMAWTLSMRGAAYLEPDPARAIEDLTESERLATATDNRWVRGMAMATREAALRHLGRGGEAATIVAELVGLWNRVGLEAHLAHALRSAALVLDDADDPSSAALALGLAAGVGTPHPHHPRDQAAIDELGRSVTPLASVPDRAEGLVAVRSALAQL